jgi:Zn-dependent protease
MGWDETRGLPEADPERPLGRAARILNASLPLFPVAGIRLRLHWSFFLVALVFAGWTARENPGGGALAAVAWGSVQAAILYTLVILHELSHAAAAAMKGRGVREIVLTPLGGAAVIDRAMAGPSMEAEVALAGPVSNLLILGVSVAFFLVAEMPPAWAGPMTLGGALAFAFWANLTLGLFNLVPAFPMDGGRVLRAVLAWRKGGRKGTRIACRTGEIMGAGMIVLGILRAGPGGWILFGIGISNIIACELTLRALAAGAAVYEEGESLEYAAARRRAEKQERREREAAELERRVNDLLEKVARDGMKSLSLRERMFLRRASRHYREKSKT